MPTLILALALVAQAAAKPEDKAAEEAIEKFKTDYKAKEAAARASAVTELSKTQHDKVYARLGAILASPDDKEVRIAAAKGLGLATEGEKRRLQILVASIPANNKDAIVLAAILDALGRTGDQAACPTVEGFFRSKNTTVLKAAVESAGELKSRTSIHPLIELLKNLEEGAKEAPNLGGGGGGGAPNVGGSGIADDMAREREKQVKPVVLKVLGALTKGGYTMAKEWEEWWRSEGSKNPGK